MLRKSAKIIVPLLILAVAVSITRYLQATKPVVEASPVSEKVWTVAGITATPVSLPRTGTGSAPAAPNRLSRPVFVRFSD